MFRSWFGKEHDVACHTTLRGGVEHLYEKKSNFLFLDFDIHDPSDSTLRKWLGVHPTRKELDGLDLAGYVAKGLPADKRPDHIIIHSRNPIGRKLMSEYLARKGIASVLWAFDYEWTGLDGKTVPPPKPPKVYTTGSAKPKVVFSDDGGAPWEQEEFWFGKNTFGVRTIDDEPKFDSGTKVRFTDAYMTEIGHDAERKWFTVMKCPCALCAVGDYVAVDEPNEFTDLKFRHLSTANLRALGKPKD